MSFKAKAFPLQQLTWGERINHPLLLRFSLFQGNQNASSTFQTWIESNFQKDNEGQK
jgi:hypothetical protein